MFERENVIICSDNGFLPPKNRSCMHATVFLYNSNEERTKEIHISNRNELNRKLILNFSWTNCIPAEPAIASEAWHARWASCSLLVMDSYTGAYTQMLYFVKHFWHVSRPLGWYCSYCAAQLVTGTSKRKRENEKTWRLSWRLSVHGWVYSVLNLFGKVEGGVKMGLGHKISSVAIEICK